MVLMVLMLHGGGMVAGVACSVASMSLAKCKAMCDAPFSIFEAVHMFHSPEVVKVASGSGLVA